MRKLALYSMILVLLTDVMFGFGFGFGSGLSIKNLYLYVIIAIIALDAALKPGDFTFTDLDLHVPFALLICYAILSWALSSAINPLYPARQSLIALKSTLVDQYLFFLAFRYGVRTHEDFLWLIRAIVGTLLATSAFTLIDFLNIPDFGIIVESRGRVEGPIGAANQYGALLIFLLPLAVSLAPSARGVRRIVWYVCILASVLLLFATGSRGAYVAFVFGSALGVFYLRAYLDMRRVVQLAGLALLVFIVVGTGYAVLSGEALEIVVNKTTGEDVSSGRTDIWRAGLLVMMEWPMSFLVGLGWNGWYASGIWKSAHNEYLNYLFELGLIGLVLFLYLLRNILRRVRRLVASGDTRLKPLFVGYAFSLAMMCIAIFFSPVPRLWSIFWSITGLVIGLTSAARATDTQVTEPQSGASTGRGRESDALSPAGAVSPRLKQRPGL